MPNAVLQLNALAEDAMLTALDAADQQPTNALMAPFALLELNAPEEDAIMVNVAEFLLHVLME